MWSLNLCLGAPAGMGILTRNGAGICKHLDVSTRWIQECSNKQNIIGHRISREEIPADALASARGANDLIETHEHSWDYFSVSLVKLSSKPTIGLSLSLAAEKYACWQMFIEQCYWRRSSLRRSAVSVSLRC